MCITGECTGLVCTGRTPVTCNQVLWRDPRPVLGTCTWYTTVQCTLYTVHCTLYTRRGWRHLASCAPGAEESTPTQSPPTDSFLPQTLSSSQSHLSLSSSQTLLFPHGTTVREHSGRQQPQRQVEVTEEDLGQEEAGDRAEEGQQEAEREACQEASA